MPEAVAFDSVTARLSLPLLFTTQVQKEIFHNEALFRIDSLLHAAISGEENDPPEDSADGDCWLVGPSPAADWSGRNGQIAMRQSGQWLFALPVPGMRIYDASKQQFIVFSGTWQKPPTIEEPSRGEVVDSEARAAIGAMISALRASGILPAS